eukprot:CAMPEP_0177194014 /NCGR_PEP_ID=MMETSP0367-20130122/22749_1 /TAXON_ID=447022 ORGANISM="Scrippsiella hangoei-like, Strain SHHI-4" /NCGR_SAMPLE_ID=MMETSP0367 /ASSEMBLY_ACC=CAM_ASM_000362 /LENGTH=50 /DNA_ID=CAMNT_0018641937 /DNA_START=156 /DNA_END=305 /DNA_ORIENTATION=+
MNADASQHAESDEALPSWDNDKLNPRLNYPKEPALVKTLLESTPVLHGAP